MSVVPRCQKESSEGQSPSAYAQHQGNCTGRSDWRCETDATCRSQPAADRRVFNFSGTYPARRFYKACGSSCVRLLRTSRNNTLANCEVLHSSVQQGRLGLTLLWSTAVRCVCDACATMSKLLLRMASSTPWMPKVGDHAVRRGQVCVVTMVDNTTDPPSYRVRMPGGRETNTTLAHLTRPAYV